MNLTSNFLQTYASASDRPVNDLASASYHPVNDPASASYRPVSPVDLVRRVCPSDSLEVALVGWSDGFFSTKHRTIRWMVVKWIFFFLSALWPCLTWRWLFLFGIPIGIMNHLSCYWNYKSPHLCGMCSRKKGKRVKRRKRKGVTGKWSVHNVCHKSIHSLPQKAP